MSQRELSTLVIEIGKAVKSKYLESLGSIYQIPKMNFSILGVFIYVLQILLFSILFFSSLIFSSFDSIVFIVIGFFGVLNLLLHKTRIYKNEEHTELIKSVKKYNSYQEKDFIKKRNEYLKRRQGL